MEWEDPLLPSPASASRELGGDQKGAVLPERVGLQYLAQPPVPGVLLRRRGVGPVGLLVGEDRHPDQVPEPALRAQQVRRLSAGDGCSPLAIPLLQERNNVGFTASLWLETKNRAV